MRMLSRGIPPPSVNGMRKETCATPPDTGMAVTSSGTPGGRLAVVLNASDSCSESVPNPPALPAAMRIL